MKNDLWRLLLFSALMRALQASAMDTHHRPADIVALHAVDASIIQDIRYAGSHNFIGRPIQGYEKPSCLLTAQAAAALKKGQSALREKGLSFVIFDCYRPTQAVEDFSQWSKQLGDQKMKSTYYPHVDKQDFFKKGYVVERSGHSRGSTVDLSVVLFNEDKTITPLDFGSEFDFMDEKSGVDFQGISNKAKANRKMLSELMNKIGFHGYPPEWWHFTLRNEPYPNTYYNFPVH